MDNKVRNNEVYKKAFELAMKIFKRCKMFPREEKYSLTDQIRRSSRSVVVSISQAFSRNYEPDFFIKAISKADIENTETLVWLEFAFSCGYISDKVFSDLSDQVEEMRNILQQSIEKSAGDTDQTNC